MDLFEFTRALVDIESVTNNEAGVGEFLFRHLSPLAAKYGGRVERMEVEGQRFNVFASWGTPIVTLSTHMDTVPPFFPSHEDEEYLWGRGACDAKGIIAAMICAVEELLSEGSSGLGLLLVVGEERNSAGARVAVKTARGSQYLINGEPTENKLCVGSKGALRFELQARGRLAHSGYPELGCSAIDALLDVLEDIRRLPLSEDPLLGKSTLNVGTISGGRAPNVVADEARAELMFRLVGDAAPVREAVQRAVAGRVELREVLYTPVFHFSAFNGLPTTVVAFTTDVPTLQSTWGTPFLIGPGSIHVAHTAEERIAKRELRAAVPIYTSMVKRLLASRVEAPGKFQ
ncbi:MAG TPA: M20/M25/M40 family metallo-hydrolase [Candidatus Acidoferrum sp.]|nr:M20/M25/M40 family metallo-hydrolase [Candidatus Acidoferrum sp.]